MRFFSRRTTLHRLAAIVLIASIPLTALAGDFECDKDERLAKFDRYTRGHRLDDMGETFWCLTQGCVARVPMKKRSEKWDVGCIIGERKQTAHAALIKTCTRVFVDPSSKGRDECLWLLGQRNVATVGDVDVVAELLATDLQQREAGRWNALDALMVLDDPRIAGAVIERYRALASTRGKTRTQRRNSCEWRIAALGVLWHRADPAIRPLLDEIDATETDAEIERKARRVRARLESDR